MAHIYIPEKSDDDIKMFLQENGVEDVEIMSEDERKALYEAMSISCILKTEEDWESHRKKIKEEMDSKDEKLKAAVALSNSLQTQNDTLRKKIEILEKTLKNEKMEQSCELDSLYDNIEHYQLKIQELQKQLNLKKENEMTTSTTDRSSQTESECSVEKREDKALVNLEEEKANPQLEAGEEHRNMPLEDEIPLIVGDFEILMREKSGPPVEPAAVPVVPAVTTSTLPETQWESIQILLNLLADNRQLTTLQYDRIIKYLSDRREDQMKLEVGEDAITSCTFACRFCALVFQTEVNRFRHEESCNSQTQQ